MSKRKRIRVKVSELLKKIESKSSEPKNILDIIPDALTDDQRKNMILISARSLGKHANLKWLTSSFITGESYSYSEEEYKRIINQGFTK